MNNGKIGRAPRVGPRLIRVGAILGMVGSLWSLLADPQRPLLPLLGIVLFGASWAYARKVQ